MKAPTKSTLNIIYLAIIRSYLKENENIEEKLKCLGVKIGIRLMEIHHFERKYNLILLLQDITFEILPLLYRTGRKIEKMKKIDEDEANLVNDVNFLLHEKESLFNKYVGCENFNGDVIICGLIEAVLYGSGYRAKVGCHSVSDTQTNYRTTYLIQINNDDFVKGQGL